MNNLLSATKNVTLTSDLLGALASSLCLAHCCATPLILLIQASVTSAGTPNLLWWSLLDYAFLAISLAAIYYSAANTSLKWMPFALYACWSVLTLFILDEKFHFIHLNHALVFLPALGLVTLHLYNRRYCRCDDDECCVPES